MGTISELSEVHSFVSFDTSLYRCFSKAELKGLGKICCRIGMVVND